MINIVIEIFATLADAAFLIWFISRFNQVNIWKKPKTWGWPILLLVIQFIADNILQGFNLLNLLGIFLCALGFSFHLGNNKKLWCGFSAILYTIVPMLSSSMVYSTFSLFVNDLDKIFQGADTYIRLIYLVVCKFMQFFLYQLVLFIFRKDKTLDTKNAILSFSFTFITAVGLGALMEIAMLSDDNTTRTCVFILSVLLIVLNIMLYLMIQQVQILLKNKFSLALMEERMKFEETRMEEAKVTWNNINKIKHDMKNHFAVIKSELNEGDIDGCMKYLGELTTSVEKTGNLIQSGNRIIDYLVNSKLANAKDTQVIVSGNVGDYSDIEDLDLACILGNIIDNAIEAEEKEKTGKHIELLFFRKNNNRIIICKNKIEKSVLKVNKQLKSTKTGSEIHGMGHQIVEAKVEKYNGLIDYFEENDMFGVQILLPIKNK